MCIDLITHPESTYSKKMTELKEETDKAKLIVRKFNTILLVTDTKRKQNLPRLQNKQHD